MLVHMRPLRGGLLCKPAGSRAAVISSSRPDRVTCAKCRRRMGDAGGDGACVSVDPERGGDSGAAVEPEAAFAL